MNLLTIIRLHISYSQGMWILSLEFREPRFLGHIFKNSDQKTDQREGILLPSHGTEINVLLNGHVTSASET